MSQFPSRAPTLTAHRGRPNVPGSMHFAFIPQSEETQVADEASAFLPNDQIHVEFVTGGSVSSLSH
jgi:hypothetical protein